MSRALDADFRAGHQLWGSRPAPSAGGTFGNEEAHLFSGHSAAPPLSLRPSLMPKPSRLPQEVTRDILKEKAGQQQNSNYVK